MVRQDQTWNLKSIYKKSRPGWPNGGKIEKVLSLGAGKTHRIKTIRLLITLSPPLTLTT